MRTEDLMEISGVVQRWKQKDDGEIYLVCKLECPWGSKRYGAGLVKCNCKKENRKKGHSYKKCRKLTKQYSL